MPVIRNTSPYGDLDVALLNQVVAHGTDVEVTDEQARALLPQAENWAPADEAAQAIADECAVLLEAEHSDDPPAKNAPKAAWVGYAISRGDADAESKTKEQLMTEHGETS